MEIKKVLNPDIQEFINANLGADLHSLLLKKSPFPDVSMAEIVQQIIGKKTAARKFPFLLREGIVFPPNISLEQASSVATAQYKSALSAGNSFVDFTCGFGIDAWFIAQNFNEITLVDQNYSLLEIVKNNWQILGRDANFLCRNLEGFLRENSGKFDLVFLDPARRDANLRKVFLLEDLSPNLLEIWPSLLAISERILVKLSPLIDITYLVSVLKNIAEIHIVAVKNDVKEVMLLAKSDFVSERILIRCVNLETDQLSVQFYFDEIRSAMPAFSTVQKYLYLPNNSVLKSGAFNLVSEKFGLKKLHQNTHFYTSEYWIENFPGRILEVDKITAKNLEKNRQYNIISRNYPLKPDEIKKRFKLRDGGDEYIIFTEDISGKTILKSK